MRVGQLDAELLDQELLGVLKEPVNKALGQLGVSHLLGFLSWEGRLMLNCIDYVLVGIRNTLRPRNLAHN